MALGAALIVQPELGTAIRPASGRASTDFVTALLVAGNSLSIVGGGDYSPHTTGTRLLFLLNSLIGASVLSLVLSYLVQVYSALRERNALALAVDLITDGTGDAAVMLAKLLPEGEASDATGELGNLVRSLAATKEAHHFYPLLFYFRFEEPLYAVSRFSFVLLDATTLIDTALDRARYRALAASAPVAAVRRGARLLLETLDSHFPTVRDRADAATEAWPLRQSYDAAIRTLAGAKITTQPEGVQAYVALRLDWEPLVRRVAPTLGYALPEIDRRTAATQAAAAN
ncbi:potassium channel family protein [Sphingomonas sp. TZW2008]|uniref:potassium channel family protein n=1 Tax=Sphingomonas sp. TZW2008 TaxID=1917973 RepID=UPI001C4E702C|nr:potassium channel family protein [Sphingomonas sp. TZW2008]